MKDIKNHILTAPQVEQISKIERFQGAFETTKFQRPAIVESLKKTSITTSSGASTRIKSALLAEVEVQPIFCNKLYFNSIFLIN